MDPIKEAFFKIKEEILLLKEEIKNINNKISNIQTITINNQSIISELSNKQTNIQTDNKDIQALYSQNTPISTGNKGVPTNKPTHQPTNQHTQNDSNLDFKEINKILNSLDNVKKEIRLKFKRLTPQEMLVFSNIYLMDEQSDIKITYKLIAKNLKLSESSIREYINKLINKGIPINKTKQNNKTVILKISQDLKEIVNLNTIQRLRMI